MKNKYTASIRIKEETKQKLNELGTVKDTYDTLISRLISNHLENIKIKIQKEVKKCKKKRTKKKKKPSHHLKQ